MREIKLPLWRLVYLSSVFCGSAWIAIHAVWKLHDVGQGVWRIVWPGLLFGVIMGCFTYFDRR